MALLLLSVFLIQYSKPTATLFAAGRVRAQPAEAAEHKNIRFADVAVVAPVTFETGPAWGATSAPAWLIEANDAPELDCHSWRSCVCVLLARTPSCTPSMLPRMMALPVV